MKKRFFILVILTLLLLPGPTRAQENNKFGIHILETDEVGQAAKLVNSGGGDWGWVTIVLRINDQDQKKWQNFFNDCRRLHLVPLVRLATENENESWRKPTTGDIDQFVAFLSSLNWPTKNQYVIVFNEPNHAKEWGGETNPSEYARLLDYAVSRFKEANKNFMILNAGFDLAADNSAGTMDVYHYWQTMNQVVPGIFGRLDAWSSHSYPNPGFAGKPTDQGRKSITGYRWEITTLRSVFGLKKDLPVFITETGWPHNSLDSKIENLKYFQPEIIAQYIEVAYKNVWLPDKKVIAVTPFILNYHAAPLDVFSWLDQEGKDHPHCQIVREMKKPAWQPEQITTWEVESIDLPQFLPINSSYQGKITLKNTGQSIWGEQNFIFPSLSEIVGDIILPNKILIEPGQSFQFNFNIRAPSWPQEEGLVWENLNIDTKINFFNPSRFDSYQNNFWQKIVALIKVWWYQKFPQEKNNYQENTSGHD